MFLPHTIPMKKAVWKASILQCLAAFLGKPKCGTVQPLLSFKTGFSGLGDPNIAHLSPKNVLYYISQENCIAHNLIFGLVNEGKSFPDFLLWAFIAFLSTNIFAKMPQIFGQFWEMGNGIAHLAILVQKRAVVQHSWARTRTPRILRAGGVSTT